MKPRMGRTTSLLAGTKKRESFLWRLFVFVVNKSPIAFFGLFCLAFRAGGGEDSGRRVQNPHFIADKLIIFNKPHLNGDNSYSSLIESHRQK